MDIDSDYKLDYDHFAKTDSSAAYWATVDNYLPEADYYWLEENLLNFYCFEVVNSVVVSFVLVSSVVVNSVVVNDFDRNRFDSGSLLVGRVELVDFG